MIENRKRSILVFIDWFLPGYKSGGPVSSNSNMISSLSDYYKFKVVTRNNDYTEPEIEYNNIDANTWTSQHIYEGWYFSKNKLSIKSIYNLLKNDNSQIVYINGIYSFYFSFLPLVISKWLRKEKIIISPRGMLSQQALMVKSFKKKSFVFFIKSLGFYNNVTFHCTVKQEEEDINKILGKKKKVVIAPNFPKILRNPQKTYFKKSNSLILTYLARVAPEKNLLFALNLLLEIKDYRIVLKIYGSVYNKEYWEICKKTIASFANNIIVEYNEPVKPEKVPEILANTDFLILPTTGENFGHSIIESLSVGTPVLISDKTPWHFNWQYKHNQFLKLGVKYSTAGWDLSLENSSEWINISKYLAELDDDDYKVLSNNAFEFAKNFINDDSILKANQKLFSE